MTDGEGNYGYLGADDSFVPFKSKLTRTNVGSFSLSFSDTDNEKTYTLDIKSKTPKYKELTSDNFFVVLVGWSEFTTAGTVNVYSYHAINSVSYNSVNGIVTVKYLAKKQSNVTAATANFNVIAVY